MKHWNPIEQLKALRPDLDISKELSARNKTPFEKLLGVVPLIIIFGLFPWVTYFFYAPLLFGATVILLPIAAIVGINHLLSSWLPDRLGKRTGQRKVAARRSVDLYVLFIVGIMVGS